MSEIQNRITQRMDILQEMMNLDMHLIDPERVDAQISTITPYWANMSDEDKDYVDAARWALEKKMGWNV